MYDGVHFYGPAGGKDFTDSVKTILMLALSDSLAVLDPPTSVDDHMSCEQAQYQWEQAQKRRIKSKFTTHHRHKYVRPSKSMFSQAVPTQNRFDFFNQGN